MRRAITIEDVESDLLYAAHLVDKYGDAMMPILERCEKEYEARKQKGSATDRIRKLLNT